MKAILIALALSTALQAQADQLTLGDCNKPTTVITAIAAIEQGTPVYRCQRVKFKINKNGLSIVSEKKK